MFKDLTVNTFITNTIAILNRTAILRQRKIYSSVVLILTNTRISSTTNQKAQRQIKTVVPFSNIFPSNSFDNLRSNISIMTYLMGLHKTKFLMSINKKGYLYFIQFFCLEYLFTKVISSKITIISLKIKTMVFFLKNSAAFLKDFSLCYHNSLALTPYLLFEQLFHK